jgi:hypothetical protein
MRGFATQIPENPFHPDGEKTSCHLRQTILMFFEDRPLALHEMMRVFRPAGHLAIAVWDLLENTPGYTALAPFVTANGTIAFRAPAHIVSAVKT